MSVDVDGEGMDEEGAKGSRLTVHNVSVGAFVPWITGMLLFVTRTSLLVNVAIQPAFTKAGIDRRDCCNIVSGKMCAGMMTVGRANSPVDVDDIIEPLGS